MAANIGRGVAKQLRIKRQTARGTRAPGGTGGQIIRRNSSNFELAKETFTNEAEQNTSRQRAAMGYGARIVNGSSAGIWTAGTHGDALSALLMRDWTTVTPSTGMSITIAGTGPTWTVTRASGSWLTDGVRIGCVGRLSVGTFNVANLNRNLLVIGVTATVLTVQPVNYGSNKVAMVAEGPIATSTFTVPGGRTFVPASGHTNLYYTTEEWMSDIPRSQINEDVKWGQATLRIPGSGNCMIDWTALGLDQFVDAGGAGVAYFTSPAAETTTDAYIGAGGVLFVNGVAQDIITDLSCVLDGRAAAADAVVGNRRRPDVFTGDLLASGSFTAYDSAATPNLRDYFVNENTISILSVLATGLQDNADCCSMYFGAVNITSATADDPETGRKLSCNFTTKYDKTGGAANSTDATTLCMQDTAVVPGTY